MRLVSLAMAGSITLALAGGSPAAPPEMSLAPGAPPPQAAALDVLTPTLSTQSRRSCARKGQLCHFRPCCPGDYCRENGDGESTCK